MPRRKTNEEFLLQLNNLSASIKPLEKYINSTTKIKLQCLTCSNVWRASPTHLLRGEGCPKCARQRQAMQRRYSTEQFVIKLKEINPTIELVSEYVSSQQKVSVHCTKCDNTWAVAPSSLLYGTGCPKCNKRYRKNTQEFKKELLLINPELTVLGEYINAHSNIDVKCNRCGNIWSPEANSLLKGNLCPFCNHSQTSMAEQILYITFCLLLGEHNIINRDRTLIGKEIDIVIKKLNLGIEFGAWYWHSKRIKADITKEQLCNKNGLKLITIYEGCPKSISHPMPENSICIKKIISNEPDYSTLKNIIKQLCTDYCIDSTILEEEWLTIISKARQAVLKKDAYDFSAELKRKNPTIKYIKDYSGAKNKVFVKCYKCQHEWYASSAYDLLHGVGCPECAKEKRVANKKLTHSEFVNRANKHNPHISIMGQYKGLKEPILCRCSICNTEWSPKANSLIYNKRNCPTCSPNTKKQTRFLLTIFSLSFHQLNRSKNTRASTGKYLLVVLFATTSGILLLRLYSKEKDVLTVIEK